MQGLEEKNNTLKFTVESEELTELIKLDATISVLADKLKKVEVDKAKEWKKLKRSDDCNPMYYDYYNLVAKRKELMEDIMLKYKVDKKQIHYMKGKYRKLSNDVNIVSFQHTYDIIDTMHSYINQLDDLRDKMDKKLEQLKGDRNDNISIN